MYMFYLQGNGNVSYRVNTEWTVTESCVCSDLAPVLMTLSDLYMLFQLLLKYFKSNVLKLAYS